jgi:hypothetical protein
MGTVRYLAFGAALFAGCMVANAGGFSTSATLTPGTGPQAGYDILRFFAKLTPDFQPGQPFFGATGLQSADLTIVASAPMKFRFYDQNADGIPDADPSGIYTQTDYNARNDNSNNGSFIRAGDAFPKAGGRFFVAAVTPGTYLSRDDDHNGQADAGFDPAIAYAGLTQLRLAGVEQGGSDPSAVTDPHGALFAMVVVPAGTTVTFKPGSTLSANVGPIVPIAIPEPTKLAWAAAAGLLSRQRRRGAPGQRA